MPDTKISGFAAGQKIQATDELVIDRSGTNYNVDGAEVLSPNALARAHGFVAWTFDPASPLAGNTQQNTHLVSVYLTKNDMITGIAVPITAAANGCTGAWVAVYDSGLNQLTQSANQSSLITNTTTGWVSLPLPSTWTPTTAGVYYLASGYTASTTLPTIAKVTGIGAVSTNFPNSGLPRGVHAAVPSGGLPNPATSVSTFTDLPLLIAY